MPQHYPKATVAVQVWCKVCHRETLHRVDSGRLGPCKECMAKQEREVLNRKPVEPVAKQGDLFR